MSNFCRFFTSPAGIILTILLVSDHLQGQVYSQLFYEKSRIETSDSNQFRLQFNSINFLRNNEYINPIYKGYTLIGFHAEPRLVWQSVNTIVSGGIFYMSYDGGGKSEIVHPVFTVQQQIGSNAKLLFGTLNSGGGHHLPHAVYSLERNLNQVPEEGLQIFFESDYFLAETWVSWEKFLRWGENKQEELSGGISSEFRMNSADYNWKFELPFYVFAQHRGGQIDISPNPIQTLLNFGTTPAICRNLQNSFVTSIGVESGLYRFSDSSPQKQLAIANGYAIYPVLFAVSRQWRLESGFWKGHDFFAKKGDPLFQNIAFTNGHLWPDRRMLTTSLQWHSDSNHGVRFGFQAEAYWDLKFRELDYSYSFYLLFSHQWSIWKHRPNV